MVLAMKEDLCLRWSHTASVYPKGPVPDISVNKVVGMQCYVLALGIQCMYQLLESIIHVSYVTLCIFFDRSHPVVQLQLYNILYTVSTQQQYSYIMNAIGYTVATCFDRKRSSSGQ